MIKRRYALSLLLAVPLLGGLAGCSDPNFHMDIWPGENLSDAAVEQSFGAGAHQTCATGYKRLDGSVSDIRGEKLYRYTYVCTSAGAAPAS